MNDIIYNVFNLLWVVYTFYIILKSIYIYIEINLLLCISKHSLFDHFVHDIIASMIYIRVS